MTKNLQKYWESRVLALEGSIHKDTLKYERLIKELYETMNYNLITEIMEIVYSLGSDFIRADANKLLDRDQLKSFKIANKEFLQDAKHTLSDKTKRQLKNMQKQSRISKYLALKTIIAKHTDVTLNTEEKMFKTHLKDVYEKVYNYNSKGLSLLLGVKEKKHSEKRIESLLKAPWADDELIISQRINNRKVKLNNSISKELDRYLNGAIAETDFKKNVSKKITSARKAAENLVETEKAYFFEESESDCSKDYEADDYIIIATLDRHTTQICRSMDAKVYKYSERKVGVNAPPFHNRCRTTTAMKFTDDIQKRIMDRLDNVRMSRPPTTGKSTYTDNVKYREWEKMFPGLLQRNG